VKSGDLSAVLLGLGRHMELVRRLREVLWRAVSYPLFVLIAMGFLLSFLGMVVSPRFQEVYAGLKMELPPITQAMFAVSRAAPVLLGLLLAVVILGPIVWRILQWLGYSNVVVERLVLPLPVVGPVLRANLAARWCDAVRLGAQAGFDLPAAIELAQDATRSGRLAQDGKAMIDALASGKPLTEATTRVLPATIPATIQFASEYHDLVPTLQSLSEMYQRQADLRLNAIPEILTPLLVILMALLIGFVLIALLAPFGSLVDHSIGGTSSGRGKGWW
ncbi:MAG TPA: type II secretion system F family protein, partial [Tepidisphaeraceae bacterium]|nr:type II secretion system F family protein [Tepidisphaeraceae bacterium]